MNNTTGTSEILLSEGFWERLRLDMFTQGHTMFGTSKEDALKYEKHYNAAVKSAKSVKDLEDIAKNIKVFRSTAKKFKDQSQEAKGIDVSGTIAAGILTFSGPIGMLTGMLMKKYRAGNHEIINKVLIPLEKDIQRKIVIAKKTKITESYNPLNYYRSLL